MNLRVDQHLLQALTTAPRKSSAHECLCDSQSTSRWPDTDQPAFSFCMVILFQRDETLQSPGKVSDQDFISHLAENTRAISPGFINLVTLFSIQSFIRLIVALVTAEDFSGQFSHDVCFGRPNRTNLQVFSQEFTRNFVQVAGVVYQIG